MARVADMDGDNNLDAVAVGYNVGDIVWYENTLKMNMKSR